VAVLLVELDQLVDLGAPQLPGVPRPLDQLLEPAPLALVGGDEGVEVHERAH
jgi:hypothetical protein